MSRVMWLSAPFAVPYATNPRSRRRPIAEEMLTIAPSPRVEQVRRRGLAEDERGRDVEVERAFEEARARVEERPRHRAARVVDDDVDAAELVDASAPTMSATASLSLTSAGHHERAPAAAADVVGDGVELFLRARREHDVGARFGEGASDRGADAAAGAGDDRDLAVEPERVERRASGRSREVPRHGVDDRGGLVASLRVRS